MKQRLLLALLMVFASVGLIGAQGASPSSNAVPINITIPAGRGEVTIQVKSENGLSVAPNLFNKSSNNKQITADGGNNTLPYSYKIEQTSSEQTVFFENASGSTDAWQGLEMVITGPVSSFVVSDDNGAIAKSLTSLSFVNNDGVLETLKLASVEGGIAYVPELTSLTIPAAKLKVLPYKGNKITTYSVGEQTPEISPISLNRKTDNSVSITSTQLGLTQEVSIESIEAEGIAAIQNASGDWELKENGVWASGTMTLKLTLGGKYEGAVINVPVSLAEVEFSIDVTATGCKLAFADDFNWKNEKLSAGDEITVTITPNDNNVLSSLQTEGLDWVTDQLPEEGALTYTFRVKGDMAPSISVTCVAQEEEKATVSLFTNVANDGLAHANVTTGSGTDLVSTADVGTSLTVSAKAPDGYVLDVIKVQGTEQTELTEKDGVYTCTFTVTEGTNLVEVYFKQGAKVTAEVSGEVSGTDNEILIMAGTETVDENTTLEPGTKVTITPPSPAAGWKLVSVTNNGVLCSDEGQSDGSYTATLSAGTNHIVATYESRLATQLVTIYTGGISAADVTISFEGYKGEINSAGGPLSGPSFVEGKNITVTFPNLEKMTVNAVYINNEKVDGSNGSYTGTSVAGVNTIVVEGIADPTIQAAIIGEGTESLDASTLISWTPTDDLAVGSSVTFTIAETSGDFQVKAVYFNGELLPKASDKYTAKLEGGTNYITVEYVSTAIGDIVVDVIAEEGGTATYKLNQKNRTVTITTTPKSGYGVESVVANGGNSLVTTKTANQKYTFTAQPGKNTVQVYFTQQAVVSAQGLEAGDITVKDGDNPVTLWGAADATTLEIGTPITITVDNDKEGYELKSVTVNGKDQGEGTLSSDGKSKTYTYNVVVGENHIVATYESTKATEVKEIVVGGSADVSYYKEGETAAITDFSTLTDGTAIDIEIEAETPNTFRTAYFNNEMLEDENEDGKYEAEVRKGENTLYVFLNDAAAIVANESENGTVTFTPSDPELNEGSEVKVSIEPAKGYEIARVYYNGQLVEDVINGGFDVTVRSGLNVVHVEYNQLPELNVEWDANAGSVTYKPKKDLTTGQEVTFTVKPNESTGFLFAQFYHNGKLISDDNEDGKYEITLVAGENNVYVKFSAEVEGHMLVKYDEQTTETTTEVTNVVISELKGDKTWSPDNGEYIDVPAATLLKVTFQVPDIKNGNVDGIVSAVINGQNYAPLTADANGVYTIGQADLANDRIVLPEGESVLRIYVKTRKTINFAVRQTGYTYNGNPQPVEFTTYPADVKNDPNLKVLYRYEDGNEYLDEAPTNEGDYVVTFSRPADDQYSEVEAESAAYTYEFSIQKAKLMVTSLPTAYPEGGTNSAVAISGGAIGYMSDGMMIPVDYDGEFTTVNGHNPSLQSVQVTLSLNGDEDPNLDYSALYTGTKVCYETPNFSGTHYTINTDNSEVPSFYLTRNGAIIGSSDLLDADDQIIPVFERGLLNLSCYTLYRIDDATGKEIKVNDKATDGFQVKDLQMSKDNPTVTLVLRVKENRQQLAIKDTETTFTIKDKPVYDSYPHPFYPSASNVSIVVGDKKTAAGSDVYENLVVTYTDAKGNTVLEPVNAGTYTVTISYAADDKYFDFTATAQYTIQKHSLDDPLYIKDPVASPLAAGLTLENSVLLGAAEIPGNYKWENPKNIPTADDDGGIEQHAYFQPIDTLNFGNHRDVGTVRVRILEGVQVVSAHSNYGKVLVKDQTGTALNMPASVAPGTKLTVSAVNTDPTLLELESIAVTMIVDGKETTTTIADGSTITFPEEGNVEIEATFKLKDNSSTIVVPDGQRAVVMPKSVRGAKLSKTGVYTVDYGESFTFTVSTLEADKDKVVVSVNGTAIQPANGVYTISNITEQQNVSVSLTSKTEVKVDIQKEYKLKDGTLIGRVTVVNNTSNDGKFYYNDELTLVAEPVKGVTFSAWSDGNKEDVRKYAIASSEVKLTASFSGVPTGIEDIESAQILAGNECIWVKNVADANVTIVGMTGRIQAQQQISGDTQIRVPAGIYVVVLENGKDVKQVKVIVR